MLPKKRPPTHPGQMLLKEFLEPMGITQVQLARHLKWPYARLNEIINGKRGVSADTALAFGESFRTGPEFWLNLQRDWDIWHARRKRVTHLPLAKVGMGTKITLAPCGGGWRPSPPDKGGGRRPGG